MELSPTQKRAAWSYGSAAIPSLIRRGGQSGEGPQVVGANRPTGGHPWSKVHNTARDWFGGLQRYELTWSECKKRSEKCIPQSLQFRILEELAFRKKKENESMQRYYHEKLSLCEQVRIIGEEAVACIILESPAELQASARVFPCKTPIDLYLA